MSCRGDESFLRPDRSAIESNKKAIKIAGKCRECKSSHLETLNLFQNAYSLHVYHKSFDHIDGKVEKRLAEGTTKSHSWQDA